MADPIAPASVAPVFPEVSRETVVRQGDDLGAALSMLPAGEGLVVDAGSTFPPVVAPKWAQDGWRRVRSSRDGVPFSVVTSNAGAAFSTAMGARKLAVSDMRAAVDPSVPMCYFIVYLGVDFQVPPGDVEFAEDIHLLRCRADGHPNLNVQCAFVMDGRRMTGVRLATSDIHHDGADSQAVGHRQGPGPFLVTDSYLEAAGECVLFGGQDPRVPGVVPGDATYLRNVLAKRPEWNPADPSFAGRRWVLKAYLELKNAQRAVFRGNKVKGNRAGWPAWVVDAFNQDGTAPWSVVQDVLIELNESEDTIAFFQLWAGTADIHRVLVQKNLAKVVDPGPGGNAYLRGSVGYVSTTVPHVASDVALLDNVVPQGGAGLTVGQYANMPGLRMERNVWPQGPACEGFWNWYEAPDTFVQATTAPYVAKDNMLWGDPASATRYQETEFRRFAGASAAGLNPDGTMTAASPMRAYGVGLDFAALAAAEAEPVPAPPPLPEFGVTLAPSWRLLLNGGAAAIARKQDGTYLKKVGGTPDTYAPMDAARLDVSRSCRVSVNGGAVVAVFTKSTGVWVFK